MTHVLVRVSSAAEAAQAEAAGFDAVEFLIRSETDLATARMVRASFRGSFRLRVDGRAAQLVSDLNDLPADEIACLPADLDAFGDTAAPRVAVLGPDNAADLVPRLARRVASCMLEATPGERLVAGAGVAHLSTFAATCRSADLAFGFAGALEAPDVARLLLLQPDLLAFDTAVRMRHDAEAPLCEDALHAIRALVPKAGAQTAAPAAIAKVTDRIFVRDFEIGLAIGAYQAEHGKRQRVRFSVTAEVLRQPAVPRDMRDVFSYDIIIETIRVLSERAHVTFVETLAEEVASSVLAHDDVVSIDVKVEKLDVIAGSVGIEIFRRRL